jgi:leader peptidase (prepilin peptidase) / N-methyltransferase
VLGVTLADFPLWFLRVFAGGMGLLWGSFLNVVIHRLPRDMNLAKPPSHCPKCQTPIKPWRNIPVVSYLLMGGKAPCCGARVSPRYAIVELLGGVLALAIVETQIRPLPSYTSLAMFAAVFGAYFAIVLALLAAVFIDLEHMYLPNTITYSGTVLGIVSATIRGLSLTETLIGSAIGFAIIPTINFIYKRIRGHDGMGGGDVKLLMLCGAWGGWEGAVFALFAGSGLATVSTLLMRLMGVKLDLPEAVKEEIAQLRKDAEAGDEEAKLALAEDLVAHDLGDSFGKRALPFGPFLVIALYMYMFGLKSLVNGWFENVIIPN